MTAGSEVQGKSNGGSDLGVQANDVAVSAKMIQTVATDTDPRPASATVVSPIWRFAVFLLILSGVFLTCLIDLAKMAWESDLFSYIVLVPAVVVWLVYLRRAEIPRNCSPSVRWSILFLIVAFGALLGGFANRGALDVSSNPWAFAWRILAFDLLAAAGGFIFLGAGAMRSLAFPFGFLLFLVPLPNRLVEWLQTASQIASTEVASVFFAASGTPVFRDSNVFHLPGISIQVAQECSGIHSSLVLFITSILMAYLFLENHLNRLALVLFAVALGILRNGLRILVIGLLCVHSGPEMINSAIHRRGGPVFFALSLVPFFVVLLLLRRREARECIRRTASFEV